MAVCALPVITCTLLDNKQDGSKLVVPFAFFYLTFAIATIWFDLYSYSALLTGFGMSYLVLAAWGFANPETLLGHIARFVVGALFTAVCRDWDFPDRPHLITKAWLEKALGYKLSNIVIQPLGGGFIGETLKISVVPLDVSQPTKSIVAKMSPAMGKKIRMRLGANVFVKEAAFYQSIAPTILSKTTCRPGNA